MFQKILVLALFCVSLERANSAHLRNAVVDFAPEGETFRGNLHVNGQAYPLTLKRAVDSVFAPNFRLTETIRAPSGKIIIREIPLSKSVSEIERSIYVDEDANAAFAIAHVDGEMRLRGIMKNIHISHDGQSHVAAIHDLTLTNFTSDYLSDSDNVTWTKDDSVDDRAVAVANPELFFTLDYKRFIDGGSDEQGVPEYLAILLKGVNNRFKTVSDPSIKFQIVGSTIIKSPQAQPFIEEARGTLNEHGKMSMRLVLRKFADYMYNLGQTNAGDIPPHDIATLLTTEDCGGTMGVANLGGACKPKGKVSVVSDWTASWLSVHSLTHELAHNLGADHDGNGTAKACSWKDGFIMSYKWNPTNYLTFSTCSRKDMKKLINSEKGACVRRNDAYGAWPEAPKPPGWYISMDEQCQKRTTQLCPDAKADPTRNPDQLCSELTCKCTASGRVSQKQTQPLDGTPCGSNGGRCYEAKCVT